MRKFLERAMEKVSRMNEDSIRGLLRVLADENERLDAVLDSMMDGIVVCDEDHAPILVNKAAERLLPVSQVELFDAPLWESVRDDELSDFFDKALNGEESIIDREFALDTKAGTRIIAVSVTPLVRDRRIRGTLIHVEETTDKRRREARLRRAESLASLTTLAAGVAHEIKNPLGSISIHVQLMRKALKGKAEEPLTRYLDIVTEEIDRLNKIVVDFLFAVRPMDITPINDDANALLRELAEFMRLEVESAGISLSVEYAKDAPPVPFDRRYLKQALLNLVKNATAAMPDGGELRLSTAATGDELKIAVEDSGAGIPEDKLGKIFEPYFTTKENGTGLGLTLTYKIIKEHGGDISVTSKPGQGSSFVITLPIPQRERRMITGACPDGNDCGTRPSGSPEEAR
ncbi:MAG: PAS domain-containing protein [Spirochaetes bacterium]|nr:PAS domain-containing protein [Spirochaetota bacterium]MBU1080312.1 PAS domain-containing protein [Spirochaetota bacterium]